MPSASGDPLRTQGLLEVKGATNAIVSGSKHDSPQMAVEGGIEIRRSATFESFFLHRAVIKEGTITM